MLAHGADVGGLGAQDHVTAVAALPHCNTGLLEDGLALDIVQQGAVALLVGLLDGSDAASCCTTLKARPSSRRPVLPCGSAATAVMWS